MKKIEKFCLVKKICGAQVNKLYEPTQITIFFQRKINCKKILKDPCDN